MLERTAHEGINWLTKFAKRILLRTLQDLREGHLELICSDGTHRFGDPSSALRAVVLVHHERVFRRVLFSNSDVGFGEAYMDGDWSSPDPAAALQLMVRNLHLFDERNGIYSFLARCRDRLAHWRRRNTRRGSRRNTSFHYDLSNRLYELFLDRSMAYSCAYFREPGDTLEAAQLQKFDRVCRKLQIASGDRVLEIGTGWGGFAVHAATRYGCHVTTTTISRQQHDYAREWFARLGPAGQRIELLYEDYRSLRGRFDKLVSIEMFEAVGLDHYDDFFTACDRLLKPEGTMLLQTITVPDQRWKAYRRRCDWIQKHIFPGADLACVSEILKSLRRVTKLTLFHAEDIGQHYARTLRAWRERFMQSLAQVRALGFDARFTRMWEYYLAACEAAFHERGIADFQLLLTKTFNRRPLFGEPWNVEEGKERAMAVAFCR